MSGRTVHAFALSIGAYALSVVLHSCSGDVVNTQSEKEFATKELRFMNNGPANVSTPDRSYFLSNTDGLILPAKEEWLFRQYDKLETWRELDKALRPQLAALGEEIGNSIEIQHLACYFTDHYLLRLPRSKEVSSTLQFYLEVLMEEKNHDWHLLASAVDHSLPDLSPERKAIYKNYFAQETSSYIEANNQKIMQYRKQLSSLQTPEQKTRYKEYIAFLQDSNATAEAALVLFSER